jgi:hypothetical protein
MDISIPVPIQTCTAVSELLDIYEVSSISNLLYNFTLRFPVVYVYLPSTVSPVEFRPHYNFILQIGLSILNNLCEVLLSGK